MPIQTIKFSQMTAGGYLTTSEQIPGLLSGGNVLFTQPWAFLPPGTTADRPIPSAAINYLLRLNTDNQVYEYYDDVTSQWVELSGSGTGTVNPGTTNSIAFYATNGTTVSPISSINNGVFVTNSSGVPGFSTTLPSGISIPGATITSSTASLNSGQVGAAPVNPTDLVNKLYVDTAVGGVVTGIFGTTNQVIASSSTGNVTLSLPQDIALGSTPTFGGLTLTSIPLVPSSGGTGINNGSHTLTLAGNLATSGAFNSTFTMTGATAVTFPTSGTLATVGGTVSSGQGTANQILINGTTGTPQTGALIFTLPQSIATTSSPSFLSIISTNDSLINNLTIGIGGASIATNTVLGFQALASNVSAATSVAIGYQALNAQQSGNASVAIGYTASALQTTGAHNVAVGYGVLASNLTGAANVGVGFEALFVCTGSNNTAVGNSAGAAIIGGGSNSLFGSSAGVGLTTASFNTFIGLGAGLVVTTGEKNTFIGAAAGGGPAAGGSGVGIISGGGNTFIGAGASANNSSAINTIAIGTAAIAPMATGSTSGTNGPGIAVGSSTAPVGFRGDGSIFPGVMTGGGFWQIIVNSTAYNIPLFPGSSMAIIATNTDSTWLPVLSFGGASVGITYSTQMGTYTRIGNVITFTLQLVLSNKGSSTGIAAITLPLASRSGIGFTAFAIVPGFTNAPTVIAFNNAASVGINMQSYSSLGVPTTVTDTNFSNTSLVIISGSYLV